MIATVIMKHKSTGLILPAIAVVITMQPISIRPGVSVCRLAILTGDGAYLMDILIMPIPITHIILIITMAGIIRITTIMDIIHIIITVPTIMAIITGITMDTTTVTTAIITEGIILPIMLQEMYTMGTGQQEHPIHIIQGEEPPTGPLLKHTHPGEVPIRREMQRL
jgi:hypothetical protein